MTAESRDTPDTPVGDVTLADVLQQVRRSIELGLQVSAPAHVVTYNPTTQRADLLMGFLRVQSGPAPAYPEVPQPVVALPQVPVAFPGTDAGYMTVPIVPGNTGVVHFTDRSLDTWLRADGGPAPVDPVDGRTHDLADGYFEPGLRTSANVITPPTALDATVVEGPLVRLGVNAVVGVDNVAIAQALHVYLVAMITAAIPVATDGGAALKTGLLTYLGTNPFTDFAATKVLAE